MSETGSRKPEKSGILYFLFLVSGFCLLASGCGFHPMYGKNKYTPVSAEDFLAAVKIGNIPDYEGQFLRNALIDRFYRYERPENPVYALDVSRISETLADLDITKSSDATRGQLKLKTSLRLADLRTGKIVLERNLQAITSYNILGSEFASRVTEENARKNALEDLARQIELHISLYLKRRTEEALGNRREL